MAALTAGELDDLVGTTEGVVWNALCEDLLNIDLADIEDRWYIGKMPWFAKLPNNSGIVANYDWAFVTGGAANRTRLKFRFIVAAKRASNLDNQNDISVMLEWTERIRRRYHNASTDWVAADSKARGARVSIEEGRKFVNEAFQQMHDAFFFVISVEVDEPTGTL